MIINKNILMISHSSNKTGGGEDDFQRLMEYFYLKGYNIYSVFPVGYRAEYFKLLSKKYVILPDNIFPFDGINIKKYLLFIHYTFQKLLILLPFFNIIKKDIFATFVNSSACLTEIIALHLSGIRFTLSIKEIISPSLVRRILYYFYDNSVKNVIVISKFLEDLTSRYFSKTNIYLIHSSLNELETTRAKKIRNRKNEKEFVILNSGVITPLKNQLLLVKAISIIDVNCKIVINFIGRIEDKYYYKRLMVSASRIKNPNIRINFIGEVKKKEALIMTNNSDLVVITSKREGMSLVFAEALYFEKPIISTRTGVALDIINDSVNGFFVGFNDANNLSKLISKFILDYEMKNKITENYIDIYKKYFNLENYNSEHEKILFNL